MTSREKCEYLRPLPTLWTGEGPERAGPLGTEGGHEHEGREDDADEDQDDPLRGSGGGSRCRHGLSRAAATPTPASSGSKATYKSPTRSRPEQPTRIPGRPTRKVCEPPAPSAYLWGDGHQGGCGSDDEHDRGRRRSARAPWGAATGGAVATRPRATPFEGAPASRSLSPPVSRSINIEPALRP